MITKIIKYIYRKIFGIRDNYIICGFNINYKPLNIWITTKNIPYRVNHKYWQYIWLSYDINWALWKILISKTEYEWFNNWVKAHNQKVKTIS